MYFLVASQLQSALFISLKCILVYCRTHAKCKQDIKSYCTLKFSTYVTAAIIKAGIFDMRILKGEIIETIKNITVSISRGIRQKSYNLLDTYLICPSLGTCGEPRAHVESPVSLNLKNHKQPS